MEQTLYYRNADGSYSERIVTAEDGAVITDPEGSARITESEYAQAVAAMRKDRDDANAAAAVRERQVLQADYESLLAVGIPDVTAQRLTGYQPDGDTPAPEGGDPLPPVSVIGLGGLS